MIRAWVVGDESSARIATAHQRTIPTRVARVVVVPSAGRLSVLDYRLPPDCGRVVAGMRVLVPLGSRRRMGVVVDVVSEEDRDGRLRDVIALLDPEPVLPTSLLRLVNWIADYYLVSLSDAMVTVLPPALRVETDRVVSLRAAVEDLSSFGPSDRELLRVLKHDPECRVGVLRRRLGATAEGTIRRLHRQGVVRIAERLRREIAPTRQVRFYEVAVTVDRDEVRVRRRPALWQLYRYLCDHPLGRVTAHELRGTFPSASAKLRALVELGLVRSRTEESYRDVLPPVRSRDRRVHLTTAQRNAVEQITKAIGSGFVPTLLWGVTGSGKTEVYLRVVAATLTAQRTALILVPEISLTHQLVDRVRARFTNRVAVLHSQLSAGERWDEWRRISRGQAQIVVGARSAVFAPLRRLGVIVVDEEHDPAYKQADGVHYQGRDVAVMRAKLEHCPLVLGSATPSIESFTNARADRYRLIQLPERVEARQMPAVRLVDLRGPRSGTPRPLSPRLAAAIEANLAAGGQTLLFLNRRGFANFLQCQACGDAVMCPNCSVALTWHQQWRALRCHYCDHTIRRPVQCGSCGENALYPWGLGTEQLESLIREAFPGARIGRMDRDTTRRKGSQSSLLDRWAAGGFDILIGTQMVAKGHDVPGVTLVGVVLADMSLNFPDFRSAERTFQLLAQVAGRAGRGTQPGRVIIQTLQPDHYSLQAAAQHDFARFARDEMASRQELGYPPFARLILLRVEGERVSDVERVAGEAAKRLRDQSAGQCSILGPAAAPLERLRQRHRRQILLRGRSGATLRRCLSAVLDDIRASARRGGVRLVVDVDPHHML